MSALVRGLALAVLVVVAGCGSDDWRLVIPGLATRTRTCAYDRAGLGGSADATGCRGLDDILGDLEALVGAAVISNDYGENAPAGDEQTNVADQQGWLVLSPSSKQVVVTSGHDVPVNEPELVVREILAVLHATPSS